MWFQAFGEIWLSDSFMAFLKVSVKANGCLGSLKSQEAVLRRKRIRKD